MIHHSQISFLKLLCHLKFSVSSQENNLLSRFMLFKDEEGKKLSDEWLRDVTINFLLAGRDTTAGTLAWFVYRTCTRPDVVETCREELVRVLGHPADDSISSFADLLNYDSVKDLHYLHSAITETLRLYPAVANVRDETRVCIFLLTVSSFILGTIWILGMLHFHHSPRSFTRL